MTHLRSQFLRFAVVGTVGFLVDAGVLSLAVAAAGMGPYIARVLSFAVAATATWYLNRRYTFPTAERSASLFRQWSRFIVVNALGACLNFGVYAGLVATVPLARNYLVLAVAAGSIAGLALNFTLSRLFVFAEPRATSRSAR
jgi:putative flippase GtrA